MVMAEDTEVETLEIDESPNEGFEGSTEETTVDPVAELKSELAALKQSMAGLDPAKITSELGRVRSLQSAVDQLKKTPAPERDTFAEEAFGHLANALLADSLISDETKVAIRPLLARYEDAKTKNERTRLRQEIIAEIQPEKAEEPAIEQSPEAMQATAEVFGYAKALGMTREEAAAVLDGRWSVGPDGLAAAVARLQSLLDAHKAQKGTATRVAERKAAAGSGAPSRSGVNGGPAITSINDADNAYANGDISGEQYRAYRKQFGIGETPGGGR